MRYDPFETFGNTDDIKRREVKDFSAIRHAGEEYRPEDAEAPSMRLHVSSNKLNLYLAIVLIGLGTLIFRSGYLQIARGSAYLDIAEENRIRIQRIKTPRGLIYDRNGKVLVQNIPNFTLQVIPYDLPDDEREKNKLFSDLAKFLEVDKNIFSEKLEGVEDYSAEPVTIVEGIDIKQAIQLKIKTYNLPGIVLNTESNREYLGGPAFSHILGYVGKITEEEKQALLAANYLLDDQTGKTGLEQSYENTLRGEYGRNQVEVDSFGKVKKIVASEDPVLGRNLNLSIDFSYQNKLQELLDTQVDNLGSTGGVAIALDPRNGEVLAMVNSPTYDNNIFTGSISTEEYEKLVNDPKKPLFNRSLTGEYPSGSTIKPLIAGSALAEGVITPQTQILSTGGIRIDKWFFPDWQAGGHGATNLAKAIAQSVNTYFYAIGGGYEDQEGLGVQKIKEYADRFGFGKALGIDLPNESTGFLPDKEWKERVKGEPWYIGDTYHLAIGQGDLLVTPLQIANLTATFANGGTVYIPHVVQSISDPITNEIEYQDIQKLSDQVIPLSDINAVNTGLREAVISGSARSLSSLSVPVAGKTGTAQFASDKTHAWFTGFAPYDNPEIVITVLIEGGGEGHSAALPVAKDFLTWYYGNL